MAESKSMPPGAPGPGIDAQCEQLAARLAARYRGVRVGVRYVDQVIPRVGKRRAWRITFESEDPGQLKRYQLFPEWFDYRTDPGDVGDSATEFAGVEMFAYRIAGPGSLWETGYAIEVDAAGRDSAVTKKTEREVKRLLRPFIRGTWRPR